MAKGKTNQPLSMMIPLEWFGEDLFKALAAQGHKLMPLPPEAINVDIIFGVNCHFMTDDMLGVKGMVGTVLQSARKRKKDKKDK